MLRFYRILIIFSLLPAGVLYSQQETRWTLDQCIEYALKQNIPGRKTAVTGKAASLDLRQPGANGLSALSGQNRRDVFSDDGSFAKYSGLTGGNAPSGSVQKSTGIPANRWSSLKPGQPAAVLLPESSQYGGSRESISLKVLDAYIQVLLAQEKADFIKRQVEKSAELIRMSGNRSTQKTSTESDLRKLRAQLAEEKTELENALTQISVDKMILAKIMQLPSNGEINIVRPDLSHFLDNKKIPDASKIYETAIALSPSLRTSDFSKELTEKNGELNDQDHLPALSAGFSSPHTGTAEDGSLNRTDLGIHPTVGVTLSIPIWQHKQVRTNTSSSKSNQDISGTLKSETKARLKKEIEQTCLGISIAGPEYKSNLEKYRNITESLSRSEDKFIKGLEGSDDYITTKDSLLQAENLLLKSKYNLIFSYKLLELYEGVTISF
jgi:outer membrane protein